MKMINSLMLTLLLVFMPLILLSCNENKPAESQKTALEQIRDEHTTYVEPAKEQLIEYQVLRQKLSPIKGEVVILDILVSEEATKEQVLNIGKHIKSEHKKGILFVDIFDSREAWRNRDNPDYPEEKYFKHYLVSIRRNPTTGQKQFLWMPEGKDYSVIQFKDIINPL